MEYVKEEIENMLKEHLKNKAKLTEIQLKKEEYEERLEYAGTVYEDTQEEIIQNMQLGTQGYDSIHSNTNKISDKVSNTAIQYKREEQHINKENRAYLENKILELSKLKDELDKKIVRVNNMMNPLSSEQKFVIKTYYMEKSKWDYVSQQYCVEFQKPKSINQLLNIRDMAIENMLDTINTGN